MVIDKGGGLSGTGADTTPTLTSPSQETLASTEIPPTVGISPTPLDILDEPEATPASNTPPDENLIPTPPPPLSLDQAWTNAGSFDWYNLNYYDSAGYDLLTDHQKFISCFLEVQRRGYRAGNPSYYIHMTTYVKNGVESLRKLSELSNENFNLWYGPDGNGGYLGQLWNALLSGNSFPNIGPHPDGVSYTVFQGDAIGRVFPITQELLNWSIENGVFVTFGASNGDKIFVNPPQFVVDYFEDKAKVCHINNCKDFNEGADGGTNISVDSTRVLEGTEKEFLRNKFSNVLIGAVTFVIP